MKTADAARIENMLKDLAAISSEPGRITRQTFTPAWEKAVDLVISWMRELDMNTRIDGFGNVIGTYNPQGLTNKAIGTGSHLDTVINGGAFDGATGLVAGLEAVRLIRDNQISLKRPLEVIAFAEEEGGVFGKGCMGSTYMTASESLQVLSELRDVNGVTSEERITSLKLPKETYGSDYGWAKNHYAAFYEIHAEQGPRLDEAGSSMAIVDVVVGIWRSTVTFRGQANHAGTTSMDRRRDAVTGMAKYISEAFAYGMSHCGELVITNGKLSVEPNQHNVVPGVASVVTEMRSPKESAIIGAWNVLEQKASEIAQDFGLSVDWTKPAYVTPVSFDRSLIDTADELLQKIMATEHMTSWAGHDAKLMAKVTPTMMIFIPSHGGYSHCPEEDSSSEDIAVAVDFLVENILERAENDAD